jgi:hypothetical protein
MATRIGSYPKTRKRSMIELEFYDPTGATDTARSFAQRLQSLKGKRIGIVSNDQWQSHRMLPMIKTMLEADFPDSEVLPIDTFPRGTSFIGTQETARLVKESGVDAVVIGNAA